MPKYKDAPQVYEVMARFKDRCLVGNGSLLWSEPSVWTTESLERVKERLIDDPRLGERSFWDKLAEQLRGLPVECYKILADALVIYSLPSTFIRPETKWGFVETVAKMAQLDPPDSTSVREALAQGFTRTALRYHGKHMQLSLTTLFALRAKQKGAAVLEDPWRTASLMDQCLTELEYRPYDMRHAILHMLFPDDFERMISTDHKRRVVAAFLGTDRPSLEAGLEPAVTGQKAEVDLTALDRDVAAARQAMIERYNPENPDFYSPRILGMWQTDQHDPGKTPNDDDALLIDSKLQELVNPLKETGQLILYGPPGTGKTYYAMKLAETLIASENLNGEGKGLTREALDSLKSGAEQEVGAWFLVASSTIWSWKNLKPGEETFFQYGSQRKSFEEAQVGDLVIGYETFPYGGIRALARISSPLQEGPSGRVINVRMTDLLPNRIRYQEMANHPVLKDSEPMRVGCRGTLFRLGRPEARTLLQMIREANPGVNAWLPGEGNDCVHDDSSSVAEREPDVPYLRMCTFHPSYGYEDFVEGFRPDLTSDGQPYYRIEDGIFKRICNDARQQPEKTFVLIIDEINRGNIPRIFGELVTLIERDKRWKPGTPKQFSAILPTSGETFAVPDNVYIIGTMNTADKSIAVLDTALRRRFAFRELMPDPDVLGNTGIEGIPLDKLVVELNRRITQYLDRNLQIGHAYFMDGPEPIKTPRRLAAVLRDKVFPLLQDYCYDDYSALVQILGSDVVDPASQVFRPEVIAAGKDDELLMAIRKLLGDG